MLEILIAIYAGICWLLIKKLKLIPWTFPTQVVVFSLPIFGSIALILSLNYYTPITSDVKVGNRSVDITTQTLGKVKKVYVKTNQEVKKGDTLFTLDPEPFKQEIKSLEAQLSNMQATVAGMAVNKLEFENSSITFKSIAQKGAGLNFSPVETDFFIFEVADEFKKANTPSFLYYKYSTSWNSDDNEGVYVIRKINAK